MDGDSNWKGNVAELKIAAEATRLGISVLRPMAEHGRYDLGFEVGGRILRVQCKWAHTRGAVVVVNSRASWHSPTRGYVRTTYGPGEVDIIAAYCSELEAFYAIPVADYAGQTQISLRLAPARNRQRAALNFAADYPLGAVAQLAERFDGIEEARGSNPLSSTSVSGRRCPAETIGAHDFRNLFGWYIQRAAAGERFLVTRRGKPLARVSPPDEQLAVAPRPLRLPLATMEQVVAGSRG